MKPAAPRRGVPATQRRRVGLISLGCAKNLVDTEVMAGHLSRAGCVFVNDPAQAEVLVINTCTFIEPAREESVRTILEAAAYKDRGRLRRLVVAGCMVQRHADELRKSLPEVDAFVGLDELDRIVAAAGLPDPGPRGGGGLRVLGPSGRSTYLYDDRTPRRLATPRWHAYLKIAEGCDHACAFCAIPAFRGHYRSRRPESVVREAHSLAGRGVRELSLIAQDTSRFGRDLGLRDGLARLLRELNGIDGLRWIRVHYLYPNTVRPSLIETMARLPRVVKYIDLPLQHAHPDTLARMRRGGSADSHLRLIERFRSTMPEVAVRSTVIVGFPGETEHEFNTLLEFVRAARFDHLGVFAYSHEEGTPAVGLADDVPGPVKQERRDHVMASQQGIVLERGASWIGREAEVLVEGAHPETADLLVGRMSTQAPDVDGQILIHDGVARPGEFVRVELTEVAGYDLVGRIVGPA
jgi:ribosomal protein S12 methylthiotransferase